MISGGNVEQRIWVASAGSASAAGADNVSFQFGVDGSAVGNTITNNTGVELTCGTSLAPAPDSELPPVEDVIAAGQTIYESGPIQPGEVMQTIADVPDGTYVVLASCTRQDDQPAMWVSAYPGIEDHLGAFGIDAYTVQEASPIVTVGGAETEPDLPDLGTFFGS